MTFMWKETLEQPEALKRCIDRNQTIIAETVKEIRMADIHTVVIAARGTSDNAGVFAKYVIESTLGLPVALAAPSVFTVYNKDMKLKNCLVIGLSQSGKAADVLEVIRSANNCGALTISITNDEGSPLAQEAKYHFFCNVGLEKSVAATKTFTSEMMLLANLVAEWTGDKSIKRELEQVPSNLLKLFKEDEKITAKVERYRFMNECFVLSRGINYAIALESALKIQETCYVRARAYATSDFQHGPFAMIERDMPVLMYAPNGPAMSDMVQMTAKLRQNGAEVIAVSNNKDMLKMGDCSFTIPDTDFDVVSPFYNVVFAQMFACRLSLAKGLNPDCPRGLNKVTITK